MKIIDAREISRKLGITPVFPTESRLCRTTRFNDRESEDDPIQDQKKIKVEFYFAILDTALNSLDDRFKQLHFLSSTFGILCDIKSAKTLNEENVLDKCKNFEAALTVDDTRGFFFKIL